jgi:hypothetical protein
MKQSAQGCLLVNDGTGEAIGYRLTWFDERSVCSHDKHFTDDGGHTFRRISTGLVGPHWISENQIGEIEKDPAKLKALAQVLASYRKALEASGGHASS